MIALTLRTSKASLSRCRRRTFALMGSFTQCEPPKAFPSLTIATTVRRFSSSLAVQIPSQNSSVSFEEPLHFNQRHKSHVVMTRYEFSQATLEEKEQWLRAKLSGCEDPRDVAEQVTRDDFRLILSDLCNIAKSVPGCAVRAEGWLGRLERLAESLDPSTQAYARLLPDAGCYRLLIQTWADSATEDPHLIIPRAKRWLMKCIDSPVEAQRPDTASFNSFLDAVSKGRGYKGVRSQSTVEEHAMIAQETLQMMVEDRRVIGATSRIAPNTESFNYVMRAWTRCRRSSDVAERTTEALKLMEKYNQEFDSSVRPNTKSYGMVLDSLTCLAAQKAQHCKNPKDVFNNGLDEIEMMEGIIQLMHKRGGDTAPTVVIYNFLITAWAHLSRLHPDKAPLAAERVLQQLTRYADQGHHHLRPDAKSYILVMRSWKNTKLPNRAERAAWWLGTQWRDYDFDGELERRPTTEGYNMVIRIFSENGEAEKAEEYFKAMGNDPKGLILPDSETFSYLIKAWCAAAEKTGDVRNLQKAVDWLDHCARLEGDESYGIRLSTELYCGVLAAARKCAPHFPSETLSMALDVFAKMQKSHHIVGPLEYTRLLQVGLICLSSSENNQSRTEFVRSLVRDCTEAGLISGPLVRTITNGRTYYEGWTPEERSSMARELFSWPFPYSWTRNIRDDGYLPKPSDLRKAARNKTMAQGEDPYGKR